VTCSFFWRFPCGLPATHQVVATGEFLCSEHARVTLQPMRRVGRG
jgi:hypothetical protein